jgi:hypothetical protein
MKPTFLAAALAPLLLTACADPYFFHGAFAAAHGRAVNARQYKADVKACGSGPGSEWCRIAADNGNLDRAFPLDMKPLPKGQVYVFDASQCDGVFEHGLCRGVSRARVSPTPTCHGETIDGACAAPVF